MEASSLPEAGVPAGACGCGKGRIAVLGSGSWGTALAHSLSAVGGHDVVLWARRADAAEAMATTRHNPRYLPGITLPERMAITASLDEALDGAWLWVFAVPAPYVREVAGLAHAYTAQNPVIVSVAKGIENGSLCTTTAVLRDALPELDPDRIGVLYGPSHAEEVAAGQPTSVVVAFPHGHAGECVRAAFMTDALRVYVNHDLIGTEIAGSVKNVMALAAGMGDGLGLGDNAKAALVTRGLAEIRRLGMAMGADAGTFAGLAGLGDLVVTCFSRHSRNRHFGEMIGGGKSLAETEAAMTMVAEGVKTTVSTRALARRENVEMPITEAVYSILFEGLDPRDAVTGLMTRGPKPEHAGSEAYACPEPEERATG